MRTIKELRKPEKIDSPSFPLIYFLVSLSLTLALFTSPVAGQDMPVRTIDHGKLSPASVGQPSSVSATQRGSASYSFAIPLPKFFVDFPLTLSYDSASATAPGGEFGAGWSLSLPEVKRDIRGTPHATADDWFFYNGQRLLHTGNNEYHTVQENHHRIFFNVSQNQWEITAPDGRKMVLAAMANYPGKAYAERWRISSVRNPMGHEIRFKYWYENNPPSGYRYPYLSEISYHPLAEEESIVVQSIKASKIVSHGGDSYLVATFAQPVPKGDKEVANLNTHLTPITYRIESVTVKRESNRRSRYEFHYQQSKATHRSQLWKIREFGADDNGVKDTTFEYGKAISVGLEDPYARNYIYGNNRIASHHTGDFNLNGIQDYLALERLGNVHFVDGANACPGTNPCNIPYENWLSLGGYWDGKNGLTRVGDINGDGLLDFMLITSDKYSMGEPWIAYMKRIFFWLSNGHYFGPQTHAAFPYQVDWYISDDGSLSDDFFLMDIDGDGRTDLVWISSKVNGTPQWARNVHPQENFYVPPTLPFGYSFTPIQGLHWSRGRMRVGDFNGDGLVDFFDSLSLPNHSPMMYLNRRDGFVQKDWGAISVPGSGVAVGDVNRDGFDDLVFIGTKATGQGCEYTVKVATSDGTQFNSFTPIGSKVVTDRFFTSWCGAPFNASLQDVDGDGDLDFVITYDPEALTQLIIPNTFADGLVNQDLLEKITLPTGGTLSLEYLTADSDWQDVSQPGSRPWRLGPLGFRPVLSKVTLEDRMGNGGWVAYDYKNGFYDVVTKEFRGFEKVIKTFPDGLKEFTWYYVKNRDYYQLYDGWAGKVSFEEFRGEDGSSYRYHEYFYDPYQDPVTKVFSPHLRKKIIYSCDSISGGACEAARTDYEWTMYGAIKSIDYYDFDQKVKRSEVYEYAENVNSWIVNKPHTKKIHRGKLGDLLVKETYGYDGQAVGVPPIQGKLTRKTIEDLTVKGRLLMGSSAVATTQYQHDSYGNVREEISPEGKVTTWDYSGNAYLFPYTMTVKAGNKDLTTTTVYDLVQDRLKTETDPNGHTTQYKHDRFGRIQKIIRPGDTEASPTQNYYYQDFSVPNYVEKTIKGDTLKSTVEREYVDGLGRFKGQVAGKGVVGPSDSLWVQNQVTGYDGNGRKKRVYEPFVSTSAALIPSPPATPYTSYDYRDNKVNVVHHPDGNTIHYYYLRDGVQITDERKIVTLKFHDAFGNITWVTEDAGTGDAGGPQVQTTTYQYDELNHLTQSKDPRGLITEYKYDAYGRIRGVNAPDTSLSKRNGYQVWYDYDGDGNQTYIWKGLEVVKNEYDDLGRLAKSYTSRNRGYTYTPETVHIYDDLSLSQNSLGRLAKSQIASGNVWYRYDYDPRGRVENQEFWLDGNQFMMRYTYDSADRLLSLTDPRGKLVQYTYNRLGQLNTAWAETAITYDGKTVVKTFGYNPRGQMTDIYYGHGLHLQYAYNARGWMTAMKDGGSPEIFKLDYDEYDPSGNLRHVKGHLNNYLFDYTYIYDNHKRMETASGISGTRALQLGFKYDDSGNILEKKELDGTLSVYTIVSGTNRLDTITPSDRRFFYNSHGNLTYIIKSGSLEASFGYDPRGRLVSFSRNGQSGQYLYDPLGRKVMATVRGQTTYYVYDPYGQLMAMKEAVNGWTTFIYGNGQRMARVDNSGTLQYFHNDYLGSARLITEGPPFSWVPLQVLLSGPSQLKMGEVGTFVATVSPSSGNYWYDWYKKILDDPWISEGITSIPEKKIKMLDDDMIVKVEVWDLEALGYGSATHRVALEYPKPGPRDPVSTGFKVFKSQSEEGNNRTPTGNITGGTGAISVVWFQDYLPYGERLAGDQGGNDFAFTGKEREDSSGLYDYGARWYDPYLGRFIQLDSYLGDVSEPKTLNRYTYALNNPLRYVDRDGHAGEDAQENTAQKITIVFVKSALSETARHSTDYLVKVDARMAARSGGSAAQTGQVLRATGTLFSFVASFGLNLAAGDSPGGAALKAGGLITAAKLLRAPGLAVGALYSTITSFLAVTKDINERMERREEGYISVEKWGGGYYFVIHYGTELTKGNEKAALEAAKSELNALLEKENAQKEEKEKSKK